MPIFLTHWGPTGPSSRLMANNLDEAAQVVIARLGQIGLAWKRMIRPGEDTKTGLQWHGYVLNFGSPVPRYGDQEEFSVAIGILNYPTYFDILRIENEARERKKEKDSENT